MRPKPEPIVFKNVDCKTGEALANIENTVTIIKADGSTQVETIISNVNGEVPVSSGIGDRISIVARSKNICPNEYLMNDNTIKDALYDDLKDNASARVIPLCRKPAPVEKFRIVDADDQSKGVEGARYSIIADGVNVGSGVSGADGWFEVDCVYPCQNVSIVANGSSVGYGMNDTKVKDVDYSEIMHPNPENLRTIPLEENPIEVKFCDVDQDGNAISGATNDIYVNGSLVATKDGGCFTVEAQPDDKIKIVGKYDGQVNDRKIDGSKSLRELENGSQNDRNIPFEVPIRVQFCDVDQDGNAISGATNDIYVNGSLVATKNGGCFYVEAKPDDKIKIIGKYDGQENNRKVDGSKSLRELENGSQNDRNIPFEEHILGCEGSNSGKNKSTKRKHDLNGCDNFTITWNLGDKYPDKITIYCGTGILKRKIFTTGMVTGEGTKTLSCNKKRILIKVEANTDKGTSWDYDLKCNCN